MSSNQTLQERFENHISFTKDYSKIPCQRKNDKGELIFYKPKKPTGNMLRLNEVNNFGVIDIDINHSKNKRFW